MTSQIEPVGLIETYIRTYKEHMRITPASEIASAVVAPLRCWASGVAALDSALSGGLAFGRVHEVFAAEAEDAASAAGFTMATATGMAVEMAGGTAGSKTILWLRSQRAAAMGGVLQANGWAELGGAPGQALFGVLPDAKTLLKAAVDALRCSVLGAVVVESRGAMPELDLTASRRLALAAEASGVPLFLLRVDATPVSSAAATRWQIAAAPSQALPGNAPGHPTFDLELLRQKSGPSGLNWRLEWDRDQRTFRETALCGAVAPIPVGRPAADSTGTAFSRDTKHAA